MHSLAFNISLKLHFICVLKDVKFFVIVEQHRVILSGEQPDYINAVSANVSHYTFTV